MGFYEKPFKFEAEIPGPEPKPDSDIAHSGCSSKIDKNIKYNGLIEHKQNAFHNDISSQRAHKPIACTELHAAIQPFKTD